MCFFDCCMPKKSLDSTDELDEISEEYELIRKNTTMRKNRIMKDAKDRVIKHRSNSVCYDDNMIPILKSGK